MARLTLAVDEAAILERRRADDIAEGEAGERSFDHVLGLHDRDVRSQHRLAVDVMELCAHHRRTECLDLDAGSDQFAGKRLGEGADERFRGGVGRALRQVRLVHARAEGQHGGDVDDGPVTARQHRRQGGPAKPDGNVVWRYNCALGDVRIELDEGPVSLEARIVDEHRQVAGGRALLDRGRPSEVVRSATTISAVAPSVSISRASSESRSCRRATRIRWKPSRASRWAKARPMPDEAP